MTRLDRVLGLTAALAATLGIWWGSTVRMSPHASGDAVLRLSWSARPERVEECRPQSEDALARLPPHMRQAIVCEGTTAAYRLEIRRDGTVLADELVRGGGLRHDRPLYVFRDIPVPTGDATISVRFVRVNAQPNEQDRADDDEHPRTPVVSPGRIGELQNDRTMDGQRRRREDEERQRERGEAVPASLSLERRLRFLPRSVILVTYDPERRELLAVEGSAR